MEGDLLFPKSLKQSVKNNKKIASEIEEIETIINMPKYLCLNEVEGLHVKAMLVLVPGYDALTSCLKMD